MSIHRNTTYNIMGALIPLALSLLTVPIYLRLIGESRYGVMAIAWLLLGYFGLFDLGLGRATAQHIASLSNASKEERAQTFWTALTINIGVGMVGGLLLWPISTYFFGNLFKIEEVLRPEVIAAVPWLILAVPVATLSGVLSGALQGREQFLELNLISITSTALFQLFPLAVAWLFGPELYWLLPAAISARLVTLMVLIWRCHRHVYGGYRPRFIRSKAAQLLSFGGWVTVSSLVSPMMVVLDRFVIGSLTGAKTVTFYTVPFQLAQRITIIPGALSTAMFPRMASTNKVDASELASQGMRTLIVAMTPLVLISIFLIEPFLKLWLGQGFSNNSSLVGQILLIGFLTNSLALIPYTLLQARGRPDLVAKCHLIEMLPYFGLLYFGLKYFGISGAAAVFSIRVFIDLLLLTWLAGILPSLLRAYLPPSLFLLGGIITVTSFSSGRPEWFISLSIHLVVVSIWTLQQIPNSIRALVLKKISPIFSFWENR